MPLFGHKLCDICNKNRATIKLSRIDAEQLTEMLICQECNSEHNPLHRRTEDAGAALQGLFAQLVKGQESEEERATAGVACSTCGLSFEDYRKTFLLGCPTCYESFAEPLTADLRKFHGDTRHAGKIPRGQAAQIEQEVTLTNLRRQLSESIRREDFEAAAHLRDQIHRLEQEEGGERDG